MDHYGDFECFAYYIHIFLEAECQKIWFSQFILLAWFFSLYVCFIAFSWICTFPRRQTCLAHRDVFVSASDCHWSVAIICVCLCLHGYKSVLHLIQSIVWFIADGYLLTEKYDNWRKLKTENGRQDRKGSKNQGCDYHQTIRSVEGASIHILLSAGYVT